MSYQFPIVKSNDGLFGPTTQQHYYMPMGYHNKTAKPNKDKTKWILKQNEQYEVFRVSDESEWECEINNGLFSILAQGEVIMGENEERLAFFPYPINTTDPYHGWPINSSKYELSTQLVDRWLANNVINRRMHIKILRGQI